MPALRCRAAGYEHVNVKLEVVGRTSCPKWHADTVTLRSLVTYVGQVGSVAFNGFPCLVSCRCCLSCYSPPCLDGYQASLLSAVRHRRPAPVLLALLLGDVVSNAALCAAAAAPPLSRARGLLTTGAMGYAVGYAQQRPLGLRPLHEHEGHAGSRSRIIICLSVDRLESL